MIRTHTGFTSGCWDLFHFGHLVYLQRCRALCDRLIVGVDNDAMVKQAKGYARPIIPAREREDLIRNLGFVTGTYLLRSLDDVPAILEREHATRVFKHESFRDLEHVVGVSPDVELVIVPDIPGLVSTSEIIDRVLQRYTGPSVR